MFTMEGSSRRMSNQVVENSIISLLGDHPEGMWIEAIARELPTRQSPVPLPKSRITIARYVTSLEASGKIIVKSEGQMKRIYLAKEEGIKTSEK